MTLENVFQIGSMTKQFTAVAILMLEQQGKLTVNDPISKYIKDYPNGDKITIHHLLTHTGRKRNTETDDRFIDKFLFFFVYLDLKAWELYPQ